MRVKVGILNRLRSVCVSCVGVRRWGSDEVI
jgi:hypothetical protein